MKIKSIILTLRSASQKLNGHMLHKVLKVNEILTISISHYPTIFFKSVFYKCRPISKIWLLTSVNSDQWHKYLSATISTYCQQQTYGIHVCIKSGTYFLLKQAPCQSSITMYTLVSWPIIYSKSTFRKYSNSVGSPKSETLVWYKLPPVK